MYHVYCSQCGGALTLDASQRTARCRHCGNEVVIPKGYTELESSFNYAMEARLRKDFASAEDAYTEILKQHPDSAAAYWGRAISRYGVEYQPVEDGSYRLVCHQALLDDFGTDADVQSALRLAEGQEKAQYEREKDKIAALQLAVSRQASITMPYDVLIEADPHQKRSLDCAKQIMTNLNAAGLHSLCPALELQKVPRQDWEPMLYHAFTTASYMVYVAIGKEAFPADMLFDAKRFLYQKAQAQRMAAAQIPQLYLVCADLNEYEDIPDELFDHLDVRLSMEESDYLTELCDRIAGTGTDYTDALHKETGSKVDFEYTNLLRQGHSHREDGKWAEAKAAYDQILLMDPNESQAYWGMVMLEQQCRNEEELIQKGQPIRENANYKAAILFANEREQQTYRKVADEVDARAQILKNQQEAAARQKERDERDKAKREEEVADAKKSSEIREKKRRKKGKLFAKIAIGLLILAAFGGWKYKQHYDETTGVLVKQYEDAKRLYDQGSYKYAAEEFQALGDFKDSKELYDVCMSILYQRELESAREQYEEALLLGEDIHQRDDAVEILREIMEYCPEGQEVLDRWYQEALDCYAQGDLHLAMELLEPWAVESEEFLTTWREWFKMGLVASGDEGYGYCEYAHICKENGLIYVNDCPQFLIEENTVSKSVDLSTGGLSGAVVRMDGTVYVTGAVAELDGMTNHYYQGANDAFVRADVPGWKNMVRVQVSNDDIIGLKEDGTLLSFKNGTLATDIDQFYFLENQDAGVAEVIAITKVGTVFSTVETLMEELSDWTELVSITMEQNEDGTYTVLGVNADNRLLTYNGNQYYDMLPQENVAVVVHGQAKYGLFAITRDAVLHIPGMTRDADDDVYYFAGNDYADEWFSMFGEIGPYLP